MVDRLRMQTGGPPRELRTRTVEGVWEEEWVSLQREGEVRQLAAGIVFRRSNDDGLDEY
jgi:hypothetical protein